MKAKIFLIPVIILIMISFQGYRNSLPEDETKIRFTTNDAVLKNIYDRAVELAYENIVNYGTRKVMIEGAKYRSIWLETQPMAGYMYAKQNLEIGRNNIEIFMDYQREDGRLPGVIYNRNGKVEPNYCQFQGLCFPMPAFELYFLINKDKTYLNKLYTSLEKFDNYLWKTRDSDNNGCLETWCIFDTGEDDNIRFGDFPNAWFFEYPPSRESVVKLNKQDLKIYCKEDHYDSSVEMTVPIESMDIMSYSYTCRDVLSLISAELQNGKEKYWRSLADEVRGKLKSYLWDSGKNACYDRDKNNEVMDILLHNNLRCMYYGSFDQEMADKFIRYHLMNPNEFWTPMPLPSIAINDRAFKNIPGNNWSGQPQGLTFQRSIQALENYGHFAELTLIGEKFLDVIGDSLKFTQQFDPLTATINNSRDGYGPSILASLEFITRMNGIHITRDNIWWSCLNRPYEYDYSQKWNGYQLSLKTRGKEVICSINGKQVIAFTKGVRVVTNLKGELSEITGIDTSTNIIHINAGNNFNLSVEPNSVYRIINNEPVKYASVDYTKPGQPNR